MNDVKESDWKLFRRFHQIALTRYCERALEEARAVIASSSINPHERYLELYKLLTERDKELGRLFNDHRRSAALMQLRLIRSLSLLTPEEIAQFSPEAQRWMLP